jgi:hypothetical protein
MILMHNPQEWDERYEPFIRCAGFLLLARLINHGLPLMDVAKLMALMDRWCPEPHTFDLPSDEITVTLQTLP